MTHSLSKDTTVRSDRWWVGIVSRLRKSATALGWMTLGLLVGLNLSAGRAQDDAELEDAVHTRRFELTNPKGEVVGLFCNDPEVGTVLGFSSEPLRRGPKPPTAQDALRAQVVMWAKEGGGASVQLRASRGAAHATLSTSMGRAVLELVGKRQRLTRSVR